MLVSFSSLLTRVHLKEILRVVASRFSHEWRKGRRVIEEDLPWVALFVSAEVCFGARTLGREREGALKAAVHKLRRAWKGLGAILPSVIKVLPSPKDRYFRGRHESPRERRKGLQRS